MKPSPASVHFRTAPRIQIDRPAKLRDSTGAEYPVLLVDVSRSGARVRGASALGPGPYLLIWSPVAGLNEFTVPCREVRREAHDPPGHGLEFLKIDARARRVLERCVALHLDNEEKSTNE